MFWPETSRVRATDKHNAMVSVCLTGILIGNDKKRRFVLERRCKVCWRRLASIFLLRSAGTEAETFVCAQIDKKWRSTREPKVNVSFRLDDDTPGIAGGESAVRFAKASLLIGPSAPVIRKYSSAAKCSVIIQLAQQSPDVKGRPNR